MRSAAVRHPSMRLATRLATFRRVDYRRTVHPAPVPVALTIAGSDPSGGAGLQADLATFAAYGVRGASVVTALTAQDPHRVWAIAAVDPAFVAAQLEAVHAALDVGAAKTGMLHRTAVVETVASTLRARPMPFLVVDPVLASTSGTALLEPEGLEALRVHILPLASLVTPNLDEAEALTGRRVRTVAEMRDAARALLDLGARAALVKGGHMSGDAIDVLHDGCGFHELRAPRIPGPALHGTGCVLSAAVTADIARGRELVVAVAAAKRFVGDKLGAAR